MNKMLVKSIQKIQNLGDIKSLQSSSEIEFFSEVSGKVIDRSKMTSITITDGVPSEDPYERRWNIFSIYTGITYNGELVMYMETSSDSTYGYTIMLKMDTAPCNTNPLYDVSCVSTPRIDITTSNVIDYTIPSEVVQRAISALYGNDNKYIYLIGVGIVGLYLLSIGKK